MHDSESNVSMDGGVGWGVGNRLGMEEVYTFTMMSYTDRRGNMG